jgi:hypothetical protein
MSLFATTASRWVTVVVVCAVTLGAVGAVVFTTTSLGCTATNKIGMKNARCVASLVAITTPTPIIISGPTASTSPIPRGPQSPRPSPSPSPLPSPSPSAPQLTGGTLPIVGPLSAAYPPFQPGTSNASGAFIPDLPLTCRLPVYAGPPGSGGFIQFPGGNFVADGASAVNLPPVTPGAQPPPNYGPYGSANLSYDQPLARWVPVPHNAISPDGAQYAFAVGSDVYLVDVKAGTVSEVGSGQNWQVVGLSNATVYATVANSPGLWALPFSGTARQVTQTGFWSAVSSTAAYGTPTSATPQGVANTIQRLDLASGQITDWFSVASAQSQISGLDNKGNLVVSVLYFQDNGYAEVWVVTARGVATPIIGNSMGLAVQSQSTADSHGLWFTGTQVSRNYNGYYQYGQQGIVLYVAGYGVYWMSSLGVQLAGGCA